MDVEEDRQHRRTRMKIKLTKSESCIEEDISDRRGLEECVPEKLVKCLGILVDDSVVDKRNVIDTSGQ